MQHNLIIGRVGKAPVVTRSGKTTICKFLLIEGGGEFTNRETGEVGEKATNMIEFTTFDNRADVIAKHVCKGDQLAVEFFMRNNSFEDKEGHKNYGYNFYVKSFEFCAPGKEKRAQLLARGIESDSITDQYPDMPDDTTN